jgi:DHA2 family methylenomycin A resistance protein-like MFS transporter
VPRVVERTGARPVVVTGLALMTAGLSALALLTATAPTWVTAALMILVGLGGPTVIPPVIAVLLAAVPAHRAGTAGGAFNSSRQLGGALAVAVFGALLATGLTAGLRVSLLLAAAVAAAAAFTAVAGLGTRH